jgi:hypothetical protein
MNVLSLEARKYEKYIEKKYSKISDKKVNSPKKGNSIEQKHNEKLKYFENLQKTLPKRKIELELLKKKPMNFEINAKIDELQKIISNTINGTEETEYFLNAGKALFQYEKVKTDEERLLSDIVNYDSSKKENNNSKNLEKTLNKKNKLTIEYYNSINEYPINLKSDKNKVQSHTCKKCGSSDIVTDSGSFVCVDCGTVFSGVHIETTLSYKEQQEVDYKPQFTYKKSSHFSDWIKNFQAQENTDIPQEVIDSIHLECKKNRITDLTNLSVDQVKAFLKRRNYNKHYEHSIHIIHRINGIPPLQISLHIQNKFKSMFQEMQEPFEKHKHLISGRKNFLSYSYVLFKFCELLELDEYKKYFKLLKSHEKLQQNDLVFKQICKDLNWEFIPSLK